MTSNKFKNRTLSTETEYYQEKYYIKKRLKAFQNIVAIFKINSVNSIFSFFFI